MKNTYQFTLLLCAVALLFVLTLNSCKKDTTIVDAVGGGGTDSKKTIILTVDGGGIKGVIPATFLQAIESSLNKPSYKLFDLVGGTSTGGIISVALTSPNLAANKNLPYTATEIVQIYQNDGSKIFVPQGCEVETCAEYYADNGSGGGVEPYLQSILGSSTKLSDNYKFMQGLIDARVKQMFTTSYIVNSQGNAVADPVLGTDYGPYLFNWKNAAISFNDDYYVWEAARATSAAPTYFPIANVGGDTLLRSDTPEKWMVDGGMMSNDPAVWGVTEAIRTGLASSLSDIIVISLGTGIYPGNAGVGINNNVGFTVLADGNWSKTPWLEPGLFDLEGAANDGGAILNVILDAVQEVSNSQLQALQKSGLQYYRLEPRLTLAQSQMDNIDPANINSLIQTADDYLKSTEGAATFNKIVTALQSN